MIRSLLIAAWFIAAFFFMRSEALADNILLAGHRAVYNLSLLRGEGAKAPIQARGSIVFEFSGSECQGYVQNFHQLTEIQPVEGQAKFLEVSSATYEEPLSRDFRFKTATKIDNVITDQLEGVASRENKNLAIHLKNKASVPLIFQGEILFPTEHLLSILETAIAGGTLLEARVYDGSGQGDRIMHTLSIIGKPMVGTPSEKPAQLNELRGLKRWPVVISYFEVGHIDGPPIYALSFDLYSNGISRALKLDYGDFVLSGEMVELGFSPISKCDLKKN